jgi:hypothetical protein
MKIPNFIGDLKLTDDNGYLTEEWKQTFGQLFNELQSQMSDESHITPSQSSSNITQLNVPEYKGGLLYDEDNDKLKVNINGVFKEVMTV